ncbi:MogA/MoaB family molybdenum cofactor biosynthesis protein [Tuberibacillus sp. Marseille-P3662]|uniref:MogA/MoaB family molybdenum cofactor biosynthesis protein n=1 Tax=Tuberibacillus sp. Marseille-P3662 TaxID=1965358 RepID=UPI000A1C7FA0|nr:molybdenum cofactor biosynthesis protein B [Tuberibacillus sp. Marseille-P3662]
MSGHQHPRQAPDVISCAVITVSDTRTKATDKSGRVIIDSLDEACQRHDLYKIVKDDPSDIKAGIKEALETSVDVILLNGGTGIAERDVTIEIVDRMLDKEMPGFGELFRMLSYTEDIGSSAMLSRAIAGVIHGKAVFSMPGSSGAVRLAMSKLILPEIEHVVSELRKKQ